MLESALMFEARFQTYWADVDPAGIVYFPHFFRFVEQAEEELFRASGKERKPLIEEHHIWMPRVEAFSKFSKPIRHGAAIRYNFEILDDTSNESLAVGYITVVCVDATRFKATPIPHAIRNIIENA